MKDGVDMSKDNGTHLNSLGGAVFPAVSGNQLGPGAVPAGETQAQAAFYASGVNEPDHGKFL
jgi:hypothetical protein